MRQKLLACPVSTHSRLKAAGRFETEFRAGDIVSTHSRLKAAGLRPVELIFAYFCFNTQPPEGGWNAMIKEFSDSYMFQHTAA